MSHLHGRVERLEHLAGIANIDAERLAVLDKDDADFYQGMRRRVAAHAKGFESFVRTLADDELERLIGIEIRLTDNLTMDAASRDEWQAVRDDLVEALARRKERRLIE